MVQPAAKWTMIIGAIVLVGSMIAMFAGGATIMDNVSEEPTTQWEGQAPQTVNLVLKPEIIHTVFIEQGSNVTVVTPTDVDFMPCADDGSCDLWLKPGMTYIGDLSVTKKGEYSIEFQGAGDVEVGEIPIDIGAAMSAFIGFCGACCGGLLLVIGIILAFTMKGPQSSNVMLVDPNTGMLVQSQPAAQVMETPGAYAQTYTTEQPVFQEPGQQPPGQQPPPQF